MKRYAGVERQRARHAAQAADRRRYQEATTAPVAEITDLHSAVYLLQTKNRPVTPGSNQGQHSPRIRELVAEIQRRAAAQKGAQR